MGARHQGSEHQAGVNGVGRTGLARLSLLLVALAAGACSPGWALGQQIAAYPSRPIHLIVPLVPGGNLDLVARAIAEPLSVALGQRVIVENHPGSAALLGTQLVAKSAPDGYTILAQSNTLVSAPAVMSDAGYDPVRDFAAITLTCRIPMVLVVNAASPVKTVKDLIAVAKSHPGEIPYASSGNGSTGHIAAELFSRAAGVRMMHVAYKGNAQAMVDVISGQVPIMFDQISTAAPQVRAGKLRALGVTTRGRSSVLPEVPTLDEAGLPGFDDSTWNGLFAPANTPPEVLERLQKEVAKVLQDVGLIKRFAERGVEVVVSGSSQEFARFIREETVRYATLAREAHIGAD